MNYLTALLYIPQETVNNFLHSGKLFCDTCLDPMYELGPDAGYVYFVVALVIVTIASLVYILNRERGAR